MHSVQSAEERTDGCDGGSSALPSYIDRYIYIYVRIGPDDEDE